MTNIFQEATRLIEAKEQFALAILVDHKGSTPQKKGAKAIFLRDGRCIGTLGGGCLEMEARRRAIQAMEKGEHAFFKLVLDNDFGWDDGLLCGGAVEIFLDVEPQHNAPIWKQLSEPPREPMELSIIISSDAPNEIGRADYTPHSATKNQKSEIKNRYYLETVSPRPVLLIAGAGHVGQATAAFAAMVGFDVVVIDDRASYACKERFPSAKQILVAEPAKAVREFPIHEDTYICIVTRGHRNDAQVLRECIASTAAYLGMIGSRRKIRKIFDEFLQEGIVADKQLKRVHAPIGLDIGSETVEEIALSIVAQLVQVRAERRKQAEDRG